jgi:hypothetical protein
MRKQGANPGLTEALQALTLPTGGPTEADRPEPRPFPGHKEKALPGQIDIFGNTTPGWELPRDEEATPTP